MPDRGASLLALSYANAQQRLAEDGRRAVAMAADAAQLREATNIVAQGVLREQRRIASIARFTAAPLPRAAQLSASLADAGKGLLLTFLPVPEAQRVASAGFRLPSADPRVPVRNASVKGPLAPDGEWVIDKTGESAATIAIARAPDAGDVTYEVVNFIDGVRSVGEIRDAVSAELRPIDLRAVAEYLELLAKAGAVSFKK